jgi:hypothetical protein
LKENFFILSKDKDEELTGKQKVDITMKGIKSMDASIIAAKTDFIQGLQVGLFCSDKFFVRLDLEYPFCGTTRLLQSDSWQQQEEIHQHAG